MILRIVIILLALTGMLLISIGMPACALNNSPQAAVEGVIYPAEVPASFEAMIAYRTVNTGDAPFKYKWSADTGMIKGEGQSVIWVAPDVTGKYSISVKVTDADGKETDNHVTIDVVPFIKNAIDANPDVVLQIPSAGTVIEGLQVCMNPMTTAVIACSESDAATNKYTYAWSCNGGKMMGQGIREGVASKIGWTSPGMAGNYTVKVTAADGAGNISIGHVYVYVKAPHCCEPSKSEDVFQWKK
jgi:hypothetical protein